MAVRLDMMKFLFRLVRGGNARTQCRSPLRHWQRSGSSFCLAIAVVFAAGIAFAGSARADTDAGLAYLKEGYYIKAMQELIRFLYTGAVKNLNGKLAIELFELADMYQIAKMKVFTI